MNSMPSHEVNRVRSRLFAVACAEVLRPLFTRWAADAARALYERIVGDLWTSRAAPESAASTVLKEIEQLPESHVDDSHQRDFFVMIGLGVLYHTVEVVQGDDVARATGDLQSMLSHIAAELDVAGLPSELEVAVGDVQSAEEVETALEIRRIAEQVAAKVDAALEPVARSYGWTADRQRRPVSDTGPTLM
jgi:hypothetical protein